MHKPRVVLHMMMMRATAALLLLFKNFWPSCDALIQSRPFAPSTTTSTSSLRVSQHDNNPEDSSSRGRRHYLLSSTASAAAVLFPFLPAMADSDNTKFVQEYDDFISQDGGAWRYRDVTTSSGSGSKAQVGDRVVFDWSGYTIGTVAGYKQLDWIACS